MYANVIHDAMILSPEIANHYTLRIAAKIAALTFQQRAVISLRHVENWTTEDALAEKVAQETRFAVLQGLERFDGRL